MPSLAFIVEGNCEQRALQRICPNTKVVTLGLNGRGVTIAALARQIAAVTRVFSNRFYPIVVLFDREQRQEACDEIISQLCAALADLKLDPAQYIIDVADRKIENWMVPFIDRCYGNNNGAIQALPYSEGANDVGRIKVALRERKINYHKTTVGADLLCSIAPEELANLCKSFRDFRSQLLPYCHWLRF